MPTPLMLPEQVADVLGVTVATLKDWRYKGTGPAFLKVNRAVRYEPDAVEAYLESLRPQSKVADLQAHRARRSA